MRITIVTLLLVLAACDATICKQRELTQVEQDRIVQEYKNKVETDRRQREIDDILNWYFGRWPYISGGWGGWVEEIRDLQDRVEKLEKNK